MFLKLFKRSFCKNLKSSIVLLSLSVAISVLSAVLYLVSKEISDNLYVVTVIESVRAFASLASYIMCMIPVVLTFYSMHKAFATDEAYLTFTLPATTYQHLNSRILSTVCWMVISSIFMAISIFITTATAGGLNVGGGNANHTVSFEEFLLVVEVVILLLSLGLSSILHIVFAIVFNGMLMTKMKKRGATIIVVLILYLEVAVVGTLVLLFVIFALNSLDWDYLAHWLILGVTLITLSLTALCYFISYKILNRSLNLA